MAFAITKNKGEYWLRGNLTASNAPLVKKHFEMILMNKQELTIHLDFLDSLDTGSMFELQLLKNMAYDRHKIIHFVGQHNKKIQGTFFRTGINLFDYYEQSA
ncbi:hypothetical protein [Mesonia sp.]|uniref:hypothetical protein n=1 Tax=Mesonia sp. TaxID=1960830 RepID=UPI0017543E90|nr:hypothetical protein [Mesonia sp.]HIB38133.1 hypothetical protein [Mesonia sp.]